MFKRVVLALGTTWGLGASVAMVQFPSSRPIGRPDVGRPPVGTAPAFSPFLNLTNGGLPGVNYYGLVQPQLDMQQSIGLLQQQVQMGALTTRTTVQQPGVLLTGHAATFFNTSHYFPIGGYPPRR